MPATPNTTKDSDKPAPSQADESDIERPRLTPQGHAAEGTEDSTDPAGGAKQGQGDKAEG